MKISLFKNINFEVIKKSKRNIGYTKLENCIFCGRNNFYPNILLFSNNALISPYDEKVMSLNKDTFYDNNEYDIAPNNPNKNVQYPVFFFIYNFDNYYHFLYDTLPYLYTFFELKKKIPSLKLLCNYPNPFKKEFYRFNSEFLEKLMDKDDIILHEEDSIYKEMYISSSLTHGGFSNDPPENEIFDIYNKLSNNISLNVSNFPKRIYISRRTWFNKDVSNIGTNYTTRRKMMNEDILVEELKKYDIHEIFTENLSTDEKISLFSNADLVIGSIGGGMANLLFSKAETKSIVIVTPFFLDINSRFRYSMDHTNITYFNEVETYKENNEIPLYCRVKINDNGQIGEITNFKDNKYLISLSNNDVAGFNDQCQFDLKWYSKNEFDLLDHGLNSPYTLNVYGLVNMSKYI